MPFRRHTSLLAIVFSVLMVLVASMQTLHEQLAHDGMMTHCEYCLQALDPSGVIPPLLIALPALVLDLSPQLLLAFVAPRRIKAGAPARAPPMVTVSQSPLLTL